MEKVPAILLMVFNRPELTAQVLDALRAVRPTQIFVAADGPRPGNAEDVTRCQQTRDLMRACIDWPCQVTTLFREQNLGCRRAVQSAIAWFFQHVSEGIILEDDTLPHPSFFSFCSELLERYRNDYRVGMISGDNFQFGLTRTPYSYYFSRYTHIWGWATWRRAWAHYDGRMANWPALRDGGWLSDILVDKGMVNHWQHCFDQMYRGEIDTWDFQWTYSCWAQNMLTILPAQNLVKNIGFGADATHTKLQTSVANLPTHEMVFPLNHPPFVIPDLGLDLRSARDTFHIQLDNSGQEILSRLGLTPSAPAPQPLLDEALCAMQKNDVDGALKKFELFMLSSELRPLNLDLLRAVCFLQLNRKGDAIAALQSELSRHPGNNEANSLLSQLAKS